MMNAYGVQLTSTMMSDDIALKNPPPIVRRRDGVVGGMIVRGINGKGMVSKNCFSSHSFAVYSPAFILIP